MNLGAQAAPAAPPRMNAMGIIQRDLVQQVNPNKNPNFAFREGILDNGQFQGMAQPDPEELGRIQKEFEKQLNLQNAILGRQHGPQNITANAYGRQDLQQANRLNTRVNTGLTDIVPTPVGLGPEPFFISNISQELQMNGEQLRQMAMQIPPSQQSAILGRERMFYQGVQNDFAGNYLHIYNQRQRENDMYAFV